VGAQEEFGGFLELLGYFVEFPEMRDKDWLFDFRLL